MTNTRFLTVHLTVHYEVFLKIAKFSLFEFLQCFNFCNHIFTGWPCLELGGIVLNPPHRPLDTLLYKNNGQAIQQCCRPLVIK